MGAPVSTAEPRPAAPQLVRAIGRWDFTAAIINAVVGSSIFSLPSVLAGLTGTRSPLAFVAAGLGILTIMLCVAEVASRFTEAGGPYLYAREAFGRGVGFQVGWLTFWIRVTAAAANLNVFIEYLGPLAPALAEGPGRAATLCLVMVVVTIINVVGVKQGTWAVDALTVAKLLPLALLIVIGLPRFSTAVLATQAVDRPDWTHAILLLVFAYGGFEAPLIASGEVRDPRRDTAFALLVGLAVIASVYTLVQLATVGVVPGVAGVKAPLAVAFDRLIGRSGVLLVSLGAMISTSGLVTGSVLQTPRLLYAMAGREELPAVLGRIHPRFRTPDVAIIIYSAVTLAFALYGSFQWNATLSAIVRLVTYGSICMALLVLRRRGEGAGFRVPAAGVIAPLAIGFCAWLLSTRTFTQAWILGVLMAVGWALGRLAGGTSRRVLTSPGG
ncbi:MAG: amino acid transporter [Acidobacteria bacterium]|nr:MAG: amino acid transporter [Acidobacteriota bacterium]